MAPRPVPLTPRCGHCQSTGSLLRCSRCKVQHYCSPQHQAADFSSHKPACIGVLKSLNHMKAEEEKLRNHPGDWMTAPDPFTNSVGHFWGILATRDYMRACYGYVDQLARIDTHESVATRLHHVMECLRLCRSDNMGVRDIAPHLMLRLDKDQEAYDFVKWWQVTGQKETHDWGNLDLGYMDVKNADCLEDVNYLCDGLMDLSQVVAVILLKVKMTLDLISLQESVTSKDIPASVPAELFNDIRHHSVRSSVIKANKVIMESNDQKHRIDELVKQVKMLYNAVDRANKHFWPMLLNPGNALEAKPDFYSPGHASQVQHILKFTYEAWMETPGAVEIIHEMIRT